MAFTTTGILLGTAIAGLGLSAYGAVKQGQAAKKAGEQGQQAAESEAQVADYNASVADLQAADAIERGRLEENRFRKRIDLMIGEQRAGFAAGNVDVGYGSAVDTQADTAFSGELDALTLRTDAARQAWGYKVQATDLRKRAEIARKTGYYAAQAGSAQRTASYIQAGAGIATGTANLLAARYGFGRAA